MSKVLIFSRTFPSYHIRKGQPTFFVEKIFKSLYLMKCVPPELVDTYNFQIMNDDSVAAKHHTIRAGNRWKVGDKFSPRVWSGKPYASKQIIIAQDIEVKKTFDIKIEVADIGFEMTALWIYIDGKFLGTSKTGSIAENDGLKTHDFESWFAISIKKTKVFQGQIICWNENINY